MKLHRIPFLVQKMIVEELGFDERLFLTIASKRTCSLIRKFKVDLDSISITVRTNEICVFVRKDLWDSITFSIPFHKCQMEHSSAWNIGGSIVRVRKAFRDIMEFSLNDDRFDTTRNAVTVFGILLRHLKSFSNIRKPMQCSFRTIPVGFIFALDCGFVFNNIEIQTTPIESVTPEELKVLLENVQTELLRLNVKVQSVHDYKYLRNPDKERSIYRLIIGNHSWVDFSELPAAKVISISKQIPLNQMNMVLKSWVAGRNRDMEIGDFEIGKFSDLNREIIFADVERHPSQITEKEIDAFFCQANNLPSRRFMGNIISVDILREGDGLRATVMETAHDTYPGSKLRRNHPNILPRTINMIYEIDRTTDDRRAALVLDAQKILILAWADRRIAKLQGLRT
ncbi:hypothetical protein B9Z55_003303 [Caenorhabditis nigoni]|uniref:F-box domain-containing protein n=1 Tax=Caenorhabditis nigoni TaxID=1611254 RepID=A0A2G5VPI6_9PELO|nr:hypothetical protein B9Z55_003303 [Caenorhabditis nigoni]